MKKLLCFICVTVLCAGLFAGCGSTAKSKVFKVELDGNATTGFEWTYTMDKTGIVEEVSSEYILDETAEDKVALEEPSYLSLVG